MKSRKQRNFYRLWMWHHTNRCQNSLIILKIDWIDVQLQNRLHQRIQNIKSSLKYISRNSEIDRWYISNANTPTSVSKSRGGDDAQITSVSEIDHVVNITISKSIKWNYMQSIHKSLHECQGIRCSSVYFEEKSTRFDVNLIKNLRL